MPTLATKNTKNIVEMKAFLEIVPGLQERTLKHWINHDIERFRERCVITIMRKIFIDVSAFELWAEEHRGAKGR